MAKLNIQQKMLVQELKLTYPELANHSDSEILSIYATQASGTKLSDIEEISIMNGIVASNQNKDENEIEISQTALSKEEEAKLTEVLTNRINEVVVEAEKIETNGGFITKTWSWMKDNTFLDRWTDGKNDIIKAQQEDLKALKSDDIKSAFTQITGLEFTRDNVKKFLYDTNNEFKTKSEQALIDYQEGQKMCVDTSADIASGILAVGALALAPATGGASIAIAAGVGAAAKVGIKYASSDNYTASDLAYDMVTGSINGAIAPISNGCGGAIGTGVAKFFGLKSVESSAKAALTQAVKHSGKEVLKEITEQAGKKGLAKILAKQGTEYVLEEGAEATLKTSIGKIAAYTADMAVDGALSGATDGFARAVGSGHFEDIPEEMLKGFIGGTIASPFIGGGFRAVGKVSSTVLNKINNKITISSLLPDGSTTKFSQGKTGDCALLSMIDGFLAKKQTQKLLNNAVMTTADGNYNVRIGNQTVTVMRETLTDEMLADKSGVKIFEQAYRQITGNIDAGFADVVAKQFGLNPVHIEGGAITDQLLEKIAKNADNLVLSLGAKINAEGVISPKGEFQHYFSIKNINPETKIVTLVDTYDTSKTLTMSFDDVKTQGISIDGGAINKVDLPNNIRNHNDIKFKGGSEANYKLIEEEITLNNIPETLGLDKTKKPFKTLSYKLNSMPDKSEYTWMNGEQNITFKKLGPNQFIMVRKVFINNQSSNKEMADALDAYVFSREFREINNAKRVQATGGVPDEEFIKKADAIQSLIDLQPELGENLTVSRVDNALWFFDNIEDDIKNKMLDLVKKARTTNYFADELAEINALKAELENKLNNMDIPEQVQPGFLSTSFIMKNSARVDKDIVIKFIINVQKGSKFLDIHEYYSDDLPNLPAHKLELLSEDKEALFNAGSKLKFKHIEFSEPQKIWLVNVDLSN